MLTLLALFERAGLTEPSHKTLYNTLSSKKYLYNPIRLKKIEAGFELLEKQKLTGPSHHQLYIALINSTENPAKIANNFVLLSKKNLPYLQYQDLYDSLIENANQANELSKSFILLAEAGLSYPKHYELYNQIIKNAFYAEDLAAGFVLLKKKGLTYEEHESLYKILMEANSLQAKRMAKTLVLLHNNNIDHENHKYLYCILQKEGIHAKNLARDFICLKKGSLPYPEYKELYEKIIANKNHNEYLAKSFVFLTKENFIYPKYESFYNAFEACSTNVYSLLKKVKEEFLFLEKKGLSKEDHTDIYLALIKNTDIDIIKAITLLSDIGINYSEKNKNYFSERILIKHSELLIYVLESLKKYDFTLLNHGPIITKIINLLNESGPNQTKLIRIIQNLTKYLHTEKLLYLGESNYDRQMAKLESFINQDIDLTEGPLRKSTATIEVERILKKIISINIDQIHIYYNNLGHYILNLPNEPQINLSILLRNANLTQLTLDEHIFDADGKITKTDNKLVKQLDRLIHLLIPNHWNMPSNNNLFIQQLSAPYQKAINIYIDEYYLNINKFFRGEAVEEKQTKLFDNDNLENNYLIYFLIGCLLNNLINKFPYKVSKLLNNKEFKEFKDFITSENVLYRDEILERKKIETRLSNPWFFPALTSFTVNKKGFDFFKKTDSTELVPTRMVLENPPLSLIINPHEEEVVLAHGTKVITILREDEFITRIVNSPLHDTTDHRWSDEALSYALTHHLSKKYQDIDDTLIMDGREIVRPNHNLTHHFRVMNYIELVINYFKEYSCDPDFKFFCENITAEDIEWLRVAAAFSVTGRESEVSALEDLPRYQQYRLASAKHFKEFAKKTRNPNIENINDKIEQISEIIKFMGNPCYEKDKEGSSLINEHRILSTAHNLDLPRCRNAEEFLSSMKQCLNLSTKSQSQTQAFNDLLRYSIELIKIHGVSLACDMLPNDTLVNVKKGYEPSFYASSTSLKTLYDLTESVTRPIFTQTSNLHISNPQKKKN